MSGQEMEAHVEIGEARKLQLRLALLIYEDERRTFATLHEVLPQVEGPPLLAPAQPLSLSFLRKLSEGLGARIAAEVLPGNVLARTPEMLAWWAPASRRIMFFAGADEKARMLNGSVFPQPALVFKVRNRELFVRALGANLRPKADTRLKTAPYWNVAGEGGRVCLGTTRVPDDLSVGSMAAFETAFFQSEYTHPWGTVRLTTHPGGFVGLWDGLRGKKKFPNHYLVDARQTLREFIVQER
jgi:PRTRC genetic system protein B